MDRKSKLYIRMNAVWIDKNNTFLIVSHTLNRLHKKKQQQKSNDLLKKSVFFLCLDY